MLRYVSERISMFAHARIGMVCIQTRTSPDVNVCEVEVKQNKV